MELRPTIRRCLEQFAEVQSRLADFHRYAASEIQAALRDSLLLNSQLCAQAARCLESVTAAIARLDDSRPLLLFSGPGAMATVVQRLLDNDCDSVDSSTAEAGAAVSGFGRLRGLLSLRHNDGLAGRTVRLCRDGAVAADAASSPVADSVAREFVDWVAAGRWLADCGTDDPHREGEFGDGGIGGTWMLELRCPDMASGLQVLVASRLTRSTRSKLRLHNILPECALFLHHVDFARDAETADANFEGSKPEREVPEAVQLCVIHRSERRDFLMLHSRLSFVCHLGDDPATAERRQRAVDLVDAALREFMPDPAERRQRALISGEWELHELLERQLTECSQATLRQLLADLCGLSRAVRGVCNCHLAREVSSREQRRSQGQFVGDLEKLQTSARSAARSFLRTLGVKLSDLSGQIESYLRRQEVKDRLAGEFVQFCSRHPGQKREGQEKFMLDLVGQELHNWNRESQVFLKLDRSIWKLKAQHYQQLCRRAERIPELVALQSDSFSEPPPPPEGQQVDEGSLSSRTVLCLGIRQIGAQPMKRSLLQSLAVGIGMPLFAPLAAITMAIIWPVTFARRMSSDPASASSTPAQKIQRQLSQKSRKQLTDKAWDFFDKIGRSFIKENFFDVTREFLQQDASKLEQFVERYCIVPQDLRRREELQDDPLRLRRQLENFQKRADGIVAEAKLFGATRLGYAMLRPEQCSRLGIDCGVASESQLGERIGGGSFSEVFALPQGAEPGRQPLALKLINASSTSFALLETEMMRQLETDRHPNLLTSLGSVYFPALRQIGLLMPRCQCNLRQLLQQHRRVLVPADRDGGGESVLANCLRLFEQILLGVRHLHGKRILHRDLKLENVLADLPEGGDPADAQLRICDFGFAKEEETMTGSSFVGTIGYMAPELTPPMPKFTVKSDVYALGVMLWESYYGVSAPRSATGQIAVMLNGDSQLDYLIRLMTNPEPQERPHVEQCLFMLKLRQKGSEQQTMLISFEESLKTQPAEDTPSFTG